MTDAYDEKPKVGSIVRPPVIQTFDAETASYKDAYEDLCVSTHGRSPKGDWIYRVRRIKGVWRSILPSDRDGGLIVFVGDDPPPVYEYVSQDKKLCLRVIKVLNNAAVGVLFQAV